MWPRVIEISLGVWLAVSPFVFEYDLDGDRFLWWNGYLCAAAAIAAALVSFKPRLERAHAVTVAVGLWLVATGYLFVPFAAEVPPEFQNFVMVGWLLVMFAVLPSRSDTPPRAWEDWWRERGRASGAPEAD